MHFNSKKLKKLLVEPEFISGADFSSAEAEAKKRKISILDAIVQADLIADEHLGQIIANEIGVPYVNLSKVKIGEDLLNIIPPIVAKNQHVLAFGQDEDTINLAMSNPNNLEQIMYVQKLTGLHVIPYFATDTDIADALYRYKRNLEDEVENIMNSGLKIAGMAESLKQDLSKAARHMPIVKLVDTLLSYAYFNRASDIHIEPQSNKIVVRFRIDGLLHDVLTLPISILDLIVARIKILSKLRTDEHFAAQDGKFSFNVDDIDIDIRVSVLPIVDGEKIVMRVLSEKNRRLNLQDLGFDAKEIELIIDNISKPYGMILATGPSGAGKTTTLYALIKIVNKREINISTIEDPVEYHIEGINQIQVNPKVNLTFAQGLRSIVRQDPDVIMVGEIRDEETSSIAVNSAMTGHLVLSTMHTNDAATTLPRLVDMGVEPFLIASSINLIIAQRLVRTICTGCITSDSYSFEDMLWTHAELLKQSTRFKKLKNKKKIRFYKGHGCHRCGHTGFKGRVGIYEVMPMSDAIRTLIMKGANADDINDQAVKEGMIPLIEQGINKALLGITTLDEVLRVSKQ